MNGRSSWALPARGALGSLLVTALLLGPACTAVQNFLIPPPRSSASLRPSSQSRAGGAIRDQGPADVVLLVGSVWGDPQARAMALRGDRIAYVGPAAGAEPLTAASTEIHRLPDASVWPPLRDHHVRLAEQIQRLDGLDASRVQSAEQLASRAAMRCASLTDDDWLWIHDAPPAVLAQLSAQPALLASACPLLITTPGESSGLVNPAAKALLAAAKAPFAIDGVLSGPAALRQIRAALPPQRLSRQKPLLVQSLDAARHLGWSEVEAVDGSPALVSALQALALEGRLPLPVRVWLQGPLAESAPKVAPSGSAAGLVAVAGLSAEWPPLGGTSGERRTPAAFVRIAHGGGMAALFLPGTSTDALALARELCSADVDAAASVRLDAAFDGAKAAWAEAWSCGSREPRLACTVLSPLRAGAAADLTALHAGCATVQLGSGLPAGTASPADVAAALAEASAPPADVAMPPVQLAAAVTASAPQPGQPADFVLWRTRGSRAVPLLTVVRGQLLYLNSP